MKTAKSQDECRAQIKYYKWLADRCGFSGKEGETYAYLGHKLFETEFYSPIDRDSNRVDDARRGRAEYIEEQSIPPEEEQALEGPVTILEVLHGIAIRIQDQLWNTPYFVRPLSVFVSEMLENLGLAGFTDQYLFGERTGGGAEDAASRLDEVNSIITCWMERTKKDGEYVIAFDHMVDEVTMNSLELWLQVQQHIMTRYPV